MLSVEVNAKDLHEAFLVAADAVINLTLDQDKVQEIEKKEFSAKGKDLRYLLFSWLEEIPFLLITEGFAIKRIEFQIHSNDENNDFTLFKQLHLESLWIFRNTTSK